jgi:hypothetical protein
MGSDSAWVAERFEERLERLATSGRLEERLAACAKAARGGLKLALLDALVLCASHRRPFPGWLVEELVQLVDSSISPFDKKRRRQDMVHFTRWDAVMELCDRRDEFDRRGDDRARTWEKRYAAVSDLFEGTPAAGEPATIKDSYQFVEREIRDGRGWRFYRADPRIDPTSDPHALTAPRQE